MALSELQWSASVVLAAGAGLAMLTLAAGPYSHAPGNGVVLALLVCGPIVALRRWALPVLAVTAAATAVVMAEGNAPLPFGLMLGLAVYLVASRLPRRWSVPAAAVTAAALAAALVYVVLAVPRAAPAGEAVVGLVPVAAAWFIGDSVAARRRYLAALAEQAERERIVMIAFEILVTPLLARTQLPGFIDGQRLIIGVAMDQLRPAALAAASGQGGGGGILFGGRGAIGFPPMPTWAMIAVIVGWIVGWSGIGAWRMMTRDA